MQSLTGYITVAWANLAYSSPETPTDGRVARTCLVFALIQSAGAITDTEVLKSAKLS